MNWFDTVLIVVVCFLILTDLTKVLLSFVWLKLSSFGWYYDGWRNKEQEEPKIGDAHGIPSYYPQRSNQLSLGMPEWHPLFLLTTIGILLGAIFLFVTYHEFCSELLVLYESLLVLLFSLSQSSLLDTPTWESQNYAMIC